MVNVCPICKANNKDGSVFCVNCGANLTQQNTPPNISPNPSLIQKNKYHRRTRFELFTPWLIIIGTMMIGVGIIILGFIPGDVYLDKDSASMFSTDDDFHPVFKITSLQIGTILIGIGTILDGLGAGLNVKAYFDLKKTKH